METTYTYKLTHLQKMAAFGFLALHTVFFLNIACDFMFFHI
ncbi:hypothetical protein [Macrococcus equipercicus]|nr:hypothetical protein [Macrococcus equipercicus]